MLYALGLILVLILFITLLTAIIIGLAYTISYMTGVDMNAGIIASSIRNST